MDQDLYNPEILENNTEPGFSHQASPNTTEEPAPTSNGPEQAPSPQHQPEPEQTYASSTQESAYTKPNEPLPQENQIIESPKEELSKEQVEHLSKVPQEVLDALKEDPSKWKYIESMTALHKIKDFGVDISKQSRFIPRGSNIGVLLIRKDDGSQIIDSFAPFIFLRDPKNRVAQAVFMRPRPKTRWMTRLPGIGKMDFLYERIERIFNTEMALPSLYGWMAGFDAGTLDQTPITNDKNLIPLYHKISREFNQTFQGLILANTEAERLKKRGTFWEKYGVNIMLFLAILMLALAIYQNGSNIAGLKTAIGTLGGQISNLGGLLPKITGGLPTT